MSLTERARKAGWPLWLIGLAVVSVVGLAVLSVLTLPGLGHSRAICDSAVATLMSTHDLVELQRAAVLIHELDCDISRRVPQEANP